MNNDLSTTESSLMARMQGRHGNVWIDVVLFIYLKWPHPVVQAVPELVTILVCQPPQCWCHRCEPPHLTHYNLFETGSFCVNQVGLGTYYIG